MLPDSPPFRVHWDTGLRPELLQALGTLAVVSAQAEELLHLIYWKHAGLNERSGPIVTDNLNPKRLAEDIKKFISLDASKKNILDDLDLLFTEFERLNTKRNHYLHWIWEIAGFARNDMNKEEAVALSQEMEHKSPPFQVKRPIYRQSGILSEDFSMEDIVAICTDFSWLARRLQSHSLNEDVLQRKRDEVNRFGSFSSPDFTFADLFWPAPWLGKLALPESKP